jgi:hypothetical protein
MSTRTMTRCVGWVVVASAGWGSSCGGEVAGTSPGADLANASPSPANVLGQRSSPRRWFYAEFLQQMLSVLHLV